MMIRQSLARFAHRPGTAEPLREDSPVAAKRFRAWGWLCVLASLIAAIALLVLLEPTLWRALLVAVLLACPVVAVWGLITGVRPLPFPVGPVPATRGYPLDRIAPYYDLACRIVGLGAPFRRRTIAVAQLRPGEVVLDAGCGTGALTRLAAEAVRPTGTARGIDPAADMIRVARINAANLGNPARFEPAVLEQLPFDDGSFDVVLTSLVLQHLPPDLRPTGAREIHRVLRAGGRVVIVDLARPGAFVWRLLFWPLAKKASAGPRALADVPGLLRVVGFERIAEAGRWTPMLRFWVAYKAPRTPGESA